MFLCNQKLLVTVCQFEAQDDLISQSTILEYVRILNIRMLLWYELNTVPPRWVLENE